MAAAVNIGKVSLGSFPISTGLLEVIGDSDVIVVAVCHGKGSKQESFAFEVTRALKGNVESGVHDFLAPIPPMIADIRLSAKVATDKSFVVFAEIHGDDLVWTFVGVPLCKGDIRGAPIYVNGFNPASRFLVNPDVTSLPQLEDLLNGNRLRYRFVGNIVAYDKNNQPQDTESQIEVEHGWENLLKKAAKVSSTSLPPSGDFELKFTHNCNWPLALILKNNEKTQFEIVGRPYVVGDTPHDFKVIWRIVRPENWPQVIGSSALSTP